jgi:hypothetical protein
VEKLLDGRRELVVKTVFYGGDSSIMTREELE